MGCFESKIEREIKKSTEQADDIDEFEKVAKEKFRKSVNYKDFETCKVRQEKVDVQKYLNNINVDKEIKDTKIKQKTKLSVSSLKKNYEFLQNHLKFEEGKQIIISEPNKYQCSRQDCNLIRERLHKLQDNVADDEFEVRSKNEEIAQLKSKIQSMVTLHLVNNNQIESSSHQGLNVKNHDQYKEWEFFVPSVASDVKIVATRSAVDKRVNIYSLTETKVIEDDIMSSQWIREKLTTLNSKNKISKISENESEDNRWLHDTFSYFDISNLEDKVPLIPISFNDDSMSYSEPAERLLQSDNGSIQINSKTKLKNTNNNLLSVFASSAIEHLLHNSFFKLISNKKEREQKNFHFLMIKHLDQMPSKDYYAVCINVGNKDADDQICFIYNKSNRKVEIIENSRKIYDVDLNDRYLVFSEGNRGDKPSIKIQYLDPSYTGCRFKTIQSPEVANSIDLSKLTITRLW